MFALPPGWRLERREGMELCVPFAASTVAPERVTVVHLPREPFRAMSALLEAHLPGGGFRAATMGPISTLVTDEGDWLFNANAYLRYSSAEDWSAPAAAERSTEAELVHGAMVYLGGALAGQVSIAVLIMAGFTAARYFAGKLDLERRLPFDSTATLARYGAGQSLAGLALIHGFPRLVG